MPCGLVARTSNKSQKAINGAHIINLFLLEPRFKNLMNSVEIRRISWVKGHQWHPHKSIFLCCCQGLKIWWIPPKFGKSQRAKIINQSFFNSKFEIFENLKKKI
jgi:hypothetical protein